MSTQTIENEIHRGGGCCGGPPPDGVSACCVKDADAKERGEAGCGCSDPAADAENGCCGSTATTSSHDEIREAVRSRYEEVAQSDGCGCSTPGSACCGSTDTDLETLSQALGYSESEISAVPTGANMGLGCGNPQAIAALRPGDTVVDLGSGGGFDCFLASRRVGDTGRVIGVDMTPAMVSKARANAEKNGYRNVEFRLGEIESLPIADETADVIISNCVINLSPDKRRVFEEAYRVLKPGGRLAIADIVASAELPETIARDMALYSGCMAGASLIDDIEAILQTIGFERIQIAPKDESRSFIRDWAPDVPITDFVVSATIEAVKPER